MIKNKKGYRHQDFSFWSELIRAQGKSGQSVKGYCQAQGVSPSSFYRWQKLLHRESEAGSGFRPIQIQNQAPESGTSDQPLLEVSLPGGLRLGFRSLPAVKYLHDLSRCFKQESLC